MQAITTELLAQYYCQNLSWISIAQKGSSINFLSIYSYESKLHPKMLTEQWLIGASMGNRFRYLAVQAFKYAELYVIASY